MSGLPGYEGFPLPFCPAWSSGSEFTIGEVLQPRPASTSTPTPTPTATPAPTDTPTVTSTPSPTPTPTPRSLTIANFDTCSGEGRMGAAYDPATANRLDVTYQPESGRGCAARLQYNLEPGGWVAFWIKLDGADLSPYRTLVFWARSEEGSPTPASIKVELKRLNNQETKAKVHILTLKPAGGWFSIPLSDFALSSRTQMSELVFTFEYQNAGASGVIALDQIHVRE